MKVLGISAGREVSNSEILLKAALKAVEEEGHEVAFARLHDFEIKSCTGCEVCTWLGRSGKPMRCKYNWDEDDFYSLMKQLPPHVKFDAGRMRNSLMHNINEFTNLSKILPGLYEAYKSLPV